MVRSQSRDDDLTLFLNISRLNVLENSLPADGRAHTGFFVLVCLSAGDDASQDGGPSQSRDPEDMAQARVDIRKLQQFLMGQQVNPSKAMCSKSGSLQAK